MNPSPYPTPFRSAHTRASIVKILLIVGGIVTAISFLAEALTLAFPPLRDDQELGDNPMGAALVLIVFLLAVIDFFIFVATVVVFLMWLYRAHDNLRAFDRSRPLDHSAGWAVGSFFIPFVNLVVPYRAVKEVWQKSGPPDEALFAEPSPPAWFPVWWTFWLLSSFASNLSLRLSFNEGVPENAATIVSIVASGLSTLAALFAFIVVDAIDKRQEETSRNLRLGKYSVPPPPPATMPMSDFVAPMS